MFVSVTRLRLRSIRFLLPFAYRASQLRKQARGSPGCLGAQTRKTRGLAFWTLTLWDSEQSMRSFVGRSPHREVMPKLSHWCDEAVVAHWNQEALPQPTWQLATERILNIGRLLRLSLPSEAHRNGRIDVS